MSRLDDLILKHHVPENGHDVQKWIFLSGGMTGLTPEQQRGWREKIKTTLKHKYFYFDPTIFDVDNTDPEYQRKGYDYCVSGIINCDIFIINLNGAEKSVGTCQEIMLAWLMGKKIWGVWTGEKYESHPWIKQKLTAEYNSLEELIKVLDCYDIY